MSAPACELCAPPLRPLYRNDKFHVVLVDDAAHPGYCRVIWNAHVKEMSDLAPADRLILNDALWHVELALREVMAPDKVNVASLGNMTPHLHWHVIARFADDAHFPNAVWSAAMRSTDAAVLAGRRAQLAPLAANIARRLEKP